MPVSAGDRQIDVTVNLLWCRPGRVGGSEEYLVRQLSGALATGEVRLRLAASAAFGAAHAELVAGSELLSPPFAVDRRPVRIAAETTWLPRHLGGADVVHHGGGTLPQPVVAPAARRRLPPALLTIHDLQYLALPHYFSATRRNYLRATMPRSAAAAELIAVPTEFVRQSVLTAFGRRVDAERIVVVPHGVDRPTGDVTDEAELRRRYGLGDRRIVVFPAITHPHKGHGFLLDVAARTDDDTVFVMLGGAGAAETAVAAKLAAAGLEGRVLRPGRVPDADRDGLLAAAAALAFPSEYEGFGAPVIEAMAFGTPVLASDRAALPEVVGDAGMVLPLDVDAWVAALAGLEGVAAGLRAAGLLRAEEFTIARSGAAVVAAYRRLAAGRHV